LIADQSHGQANGLELLLGLFVEALEYEYGANLGVE
jgi:hypothetical protein